MKGDSPSRLENHDQGSSTDSGQVASSAPVSPSRENNVITPSQGSNSDSSVSDSKSNSATSDVSSAQQEHISTPEELPQLGSSVLTVDVFNKIFKPTGKSSLIHSYQTCAEFFKLKESKFLEQMDKYQNQKGNYLIS
jgi:hypothetical protein